MFLTQPLLIMKPQTFKLFIYFRMEEIQVRTIILQIQLKAIYKEKIQEEPIKLKSIQ